MAELESVIKSLEEEIYGLIKEGQDGSTTAFQALETKKNVLIETRKLGICPVDCWRARGTVQCAPSDVFGIVDNLAERHTWDEALLELETIVDITDKLRNSKLYGNNATVKIYWESYRVPFPVTTRDALYVRCHKRIPQTNSFLIFGRSFECFNSEVASMLMDFIPSEKKKMIEQKIQSTNCVRGEILQWGYFIEPFSENSNEGGNNSNEAAKGTHCTYLIQYDPKGWVPAWAINRVAGHSYFYVDIMRKLTQKA